MRLSRFAFLAFAALAQFHPQAAFAQTRDEQQETAARKSADTWLRLLDTGRYDAAYENSAEELKSQVAKSQWVAQFASVRTTSGSLEARKFVSATYVEAIPNAPPGKYFVLQYQAKFTAGVSNEQVVSLREKDGSWREVGYIMSPPQ